MRGKSLGGQQLVKVASNDKTPLEFTYNNQECMIITIAMFFCIIAEILQSFP